MKTLLHLGFVCLLGSIAIGQSTPPSGQPAPANPQDVASPTAANNILPALDRLQSAASQANLEIAHMRIEKWKADGASKQQAQSNADSLQRNLSSALPGLIANYRAAPQDLAAGFKLYRNLNALYDVLASFTESAGAFGPKNDYEALGQQVAIIDATRRTMADNLESLTAATQAELTRLRNQMTAMQQAAATSAKKVVVDDNQPAKKTTNRKKKPATPSAGSTAPAGTPPASKTQ